MLTELNNFGGDFFAAMRTEFSDADDLDTYLSIIMIVVPLLLLFNPLGIHKPPFGTRDEPPKLFSCFHPFVYDHFSIGDCFMICPSVGHTAGKLRHLDDESPIFLAPVNNHFILWFNISLLEA